MSKIALSRLPYSAKAVIVPPISPLQSEQQMTVFVATSKRFYGEAQELVKKLAEAGVKVYHPYFHLDPAKIDADADLKSRITIQHFPEIDESDIFYAFLPGGYIGCSVTIELTYAYAKGKKIVVSEAPQRLVRLRQRGAGPRLARVRRG